MGSPKGYAMGSDTTDADTTGSDAEGRNDGATPLDRRSLAERLSLELGEAVEVVSSQQPQAHRISGLAFCSGRVMSFVIDAQARTLRTRNLLELTRLSRRVA
jgi:hypothetical protein